MTAKLQELKSFAIGAAAAAILVRGTFWPDARLGVLLAVAFVGGFLWALYEHG